MCTVPKPVNTLSRFAPSKATLPACKLEDGAALENLSLANCKLRVEATPDAAHELVNVQLFNVRIELAAQAALSLTRCDLKQVAILGDASESEAEPGGAVFISHSSLHASMLVLRDVELLSSTFDFSELRASELQGIDLEIEFSHFHPRHATLSAITLHDSGIDECDSLLIAGASLNKSYLAGCSGITRLYRSAVDRSTIDGSIVTDFSAFADCAFGVATSTRFASWSTGVETGAFCSWFEQLRGSGGSISCVLCEGPLTTKEADVCVQAGEEPALDKNDCPALEEPAPCSRFPARERPLTGS
jgi:uncharacterized protein YjbI with pentapeptide repeats